MKMRIDELASRAGTTSRNVRAYQARGLLPAPELEGRTGFYDELHLHRLELIDELQERGFSLEAIRQTLDIWSRGGDLGDLLGFHHLLSAPLSDEEPMTFSMEELIERFPQMDGRGDLLERGLELGLMEVDEHGDLRAPSPMLIEAGTELARVGIDLEVIYELVASLRADATEIARRFLELVSDQLLRPLLEGHEDALPTSDLVAALHRLRPIATEVIRPFLAQALSQEIDRTVREHDALLHPGDGAALA